MFDTPVVSCNCLEKNRKMLKEGKKHRKQCKFSARKKAELAFGSTMFMTKDCFSRKA